LGKKLINYCKLKVFWENNSMLRKFYCRSF
jgi:hypothetical protein